MTVWGCCRHALEKGCLTSSEGGPTADRRQADERVVVALVEGETVSYRVVQLDLTTDIEVFYMLFDRSLSIFSTTSLQQHIEYFNLCCKIHLYLPLQWIMDIGMFILIPVNIMYKYLSDLPKWMIVKTVLLVSLLWKGVVYYSTVEPG